MEQKPVSERRIYHPQFYKKFSTCPAEYGNGQRFRYLLLLPIEDLAEFNAKWVGF